MTPCEQSWDWVLYIMTKTNEMPAYRTVYRVRRDPAHARRWCIFNTFNNEVQEGGFFSRERAEDHLDRHYNLSEV